MVHIVDFVVRPDADAIPHLVLQHHLLNLRLGPNQRQTCLLVVSLMRVLERAGLQIERLLEGIFACR